MKVVNSSICRRSVLRGLAALPGMGALGACATSSPTNSATGEDVIARLGVTKLINAAGTYTSLTESLMPTSGEGVPRLKLVEGDEPPSADAPPVAAVTADRPASSSPNIANLRREFAHHVRNENLADALAIGMEIAAAFPRSAAAEEFDRLRPLLRRRLGLTAGVDQSFADPAPVLRPLDATRATLQLNNSHR